jgi:hypothetical protein
LKIKTNQAVLKLLKLIFSELSIELEIHFFIRYSFRRKRERKIISIKEE